MGVESSQAPATPVTALVLPGPVVTMQTPKWLVTLAYDSAHMALACSCELQTNSMIFCTERLVQVHGAAAGYEEYMLHTLFGNKTHNVVR